MFSNSKTTGSTTVTEDNEIDPEVGKPETNTRSDVEPTTAKSNINDIVRTNIDMIV